MKHLKDESFSLNGTWELYYAPHSRLIADGYADPREDTCSTPALCSAAALQKSGYACIPAAVPGNFELALQAAGVIEDPFFADCIFSLRAWECMHQFYVCRFACPWEPARTSLRFEGIDTAAEIFLNAELLGACENMFIEHEFEVEGRLREQNELVVHIKPAEIYARRYADADMSFAQHYNFESLHLRRAASSFGWDIMPRIAGGGLWRDVSLVRRPQNRLVDLFCYTGRVDHAKHTARIEFTYHVDIKEDSLDPWSLRISGECGESRFSAEQGLWHTAGHMRAAVKDARLWMPRNYGDANLYHVRAELCCRGEVRDAVELDIGIRTVELRRTSVVETDGSGDFAFYVNGRRIYAMGTNWVPVDAFHSRDRERLPKVLPLLTELGCNMVRMWGGNVYEHEDFFNYCDENGILIWQDFAMACAIYPANEAFQAALRQEIECVVRKYRNHAALVLWAGNNENDQAYAYGWDGCRRAPDRDLLTRRLIPELLDRLDATRPYLPSSPYIDRRAFESGLPLSEDHRWGPRDYFKGSYYRNSACFFASEIGYHGCPDAESLSRFLSPEQLWGWRRQGGSGEPNDGWLAHAACMEPNMNCEYSYRIGLMAEQVRTLFGEEPRELDRFVAASQISQAEADKFFIESFRMGKPRRSGLLWWNLIDGWPQISDAVVDYYGNKKRAFEYIKRSQAAVVMMCAEPSDGRIAVYGVSEMQEPIALRFAIRDLTNGCELTQGEALLPPNACESLLTLPHREGESIFYLLEWSCQANGQTVSGKNHFVSGMENKLNLSEYLAHIEACRF